MWWAVLSARGGFQAAWSVKDAVRFGYLCALAGFLGSALKDALEDTSLSADALQGATPQARCLMEQAAAFAEHVHPWTLARLPLAPLLALMLTYGVLHLVHLLVTAMGQNDVAFSDAARALAPCLAPLALAALPLMAFGLCLLWSMVLMALAMPRVYRLSRGVAGAVTSLPVLCYAAWDVLLQLHVARPCFNLG
jgi:hypothetical protein